MGLVMTVCALLACLSFAVGRRWVVRNPESEHAFDSDAAEVGVAV
jgi:hypothetical protein